MGDIMSTGVSGLMAFQKALSTVSHNIANANTPGYSRQSVNLVTNPAEPTGAGWIGNGVAASTITRSYDSFLVAQSLGASSSYNQLNTISNFAGSINNLFGDSTTSLSASLQSFSQSIQTMANAPSQSTSRQAVINQAQTLISQFKSYEGSLGQLDSQVSTQLSDEAGTITSLAQNISSLNTQIAASQAETQQPPNDLMDQRDQLVAQLATHVNVNTVAQDDGTINVYIGSGQALVIGATATTVTVGADTYGSGASRLLVQSKGGSADITDSLNGGTVGGLLQFQQQMLIPAHNQLGLAAVTLTNLLNAQNAAGLDQNGTPGAALLAVGSPTVQPAQSNQGAATVTAGISGLAGLSSSDYYLRYNGTSWSLTETGAGTTHPLTVATNGVVTTLSGAGLKIAVNGTAVAGDRYLIRPVGQAVSGLSLLTTDPAKIAAAAPLVTSAAATNTGTASIDDGAVTNTAGWVRGNYTLNFTSASAYAIKDATGSTVATGAYTSGSPITFNGIQVTVSGAAANGDSFAINDNANGGGDNRNALKLAGVMTQKVLGNGTQSVLGAVNAYVGTVGLQTSQAQNGATAQQSLLTSAQTAQQSVSGVNLDEEAANMLRFEQAYQAAAQVIKVADNIFQSLLQAF